MAKKGRTSGKSQKRVEATKRKGWALWISSLLFVSIWMFVLGILVGRGTAPVPFDIHKLQNELKHLKAAALKEEEKRFKILSDPDKKDLEFHDALKKNRPHTAAKRRVVKQGNKRSTLKQKPRATPSNRKKKTTVGADRAGNQAREKSQSGQAALTIQVASFKNKWDADRMVSKLQKSGYPAYRALGVVPGKGVWHRVRVGHFRSRQEARKTVTRLEGAKLKPIILGESKK